MSEPGTPLLEVEDLVRDYVLPRRRLLGPPPVVRALDGVSLRVAAGSSFGIVGESGCGKSTLARTVMALEAPTAGRVRFLGHDLFALPRNELQALRRHFQIIFQDPYGSLNPRHRVARIVAEPLHALGRSLSAPERRSRVDEALAAVGMGTSYAARYPHQLSGGQRQRVAVARALITRPRLIVADEPVSALDVSIQAQILNLLQDLQQELGLTYLFISHDLSVVRHVAREVAVMYRGRIVESGPTAVVLGEPAHPYTRALLDAIPRPDPARRRRGRAAAEPAVAEEPPVGGCPYQPRCPLAEARCRTEAPRLRPLAEDHEVSCHLA